MRRLDMNKREFVQVRNSNLDHIMIFTVDESNLHRRHVAYWRKVEDAHSYGGSMTLHGRTFDANGQGLETASSTKMIKNIDVSFWSIMESDEVPTSNLTWPQPVVRTYKSGTIVPRFW
jgi:hypothetical protein